MNPIETRRLTVENSRMPVPRILLFGSSNTDLVLSCAHLPRPGETLLGGEFQRFHGGKGANQAVAMARAGARVIFVGARGDDDFGKMAASALKREGIDIRHFKIHKNAPSGIALILLGGKSRENIIAVARSANDLLSAADVRARRAEFSKADIAVAQLEIPLKAVIEIARRARHAQIPLLLNPAPAQKLPAALLRLVHTLTPNEHEAELMTGEKDPRRAGRKLIATGCQQVIITLGARGAMLIREDSERLFRAPRVKPVDTVGAGDCFTGWLATCLAEKMTAEEAIPIALQAASLSVTRAGAQSSMPMRSEVRPQSSP